MGNVSEKPDASIFWVEEWFFRVLQDCSILSVEVAGLLKCLLSIKIELFSHGQPPDLEQ
jgi:hypothetical protein